MHSFNAWIDNEIETIKFYRHGRTKAQCRVLDVKIERLEEIRSLWRGSMEYAVSMEHLCEPTVEDLEREENKS